MALSTGVLLGLIAMAGYGLADFFVERATRDTDVFDILLWSRLTSTALLTAAMLVLSSPSIPSPATGALIITAGVLSVVAYAAFYRGIQIGKLSIVSPVASAWGAVTAVIGVVVLGQVLAPVQVGAVTVVVAGTVLASFRWDDLAGLQWRNYEVGIGHGAVALLTWGASFAIVDVAIARIGWLPSIVALLLVILTAIVAYGLWDGRSLGAPAGMRPILLIGVFEAAAYTALGLGLTDFDAALVAPIAAAFPMVTVLLAHLFLDEPLDRNQWVGIAAIIAAVVVLSL